MKIASRFLGVSVVLSLALLPTATSAQAFTEKEFVGSWELLNIDSTGATKTALEITEMWHTP